MEKIYTNWGGILPAFIRKDQCRIACCDGFMGKIDFNQKNILITGGSRGLGAALGEQFAKLGANVLLAARNEERLKTTCAKIQANNGMASYFVCDVTNQESVASLLSHVNQKFTPLDVLVNNAGKLNTTDFDAGFAAFQDILDLNVNAYVRMIINFLPVLGRPVPKSKDDLKRGSIINIASMGGVAFMPNLLFYGISKSTVIAISRALRQYFAARKQKYMYVLNVNPPQFDTELYENTLLESWIATLRKANKIPSPGTLAPLIVNAATKGKRNLNIGWAGKLGAIFAKISPRLVDYMTRRFTLKMNKKPKEESV